jgi:rod shape determining protein RodA
MSHIKFQSDISLLDRFKNLSWGLMLGIFLIASIGFVSLYSAAGGNLDPYASRQMARFALGIGVMIVIALIDVRWWYKMAWLIYFGTLVLLLIVEITGHIGMGAQRWINLGFMHVQPSELMKLALVLVLARYFHSATIEDMRRIRFLIIPAILVIVPVGLVMTQPDLGTGLKLVMVGTSVFFIAGAPLWMFLLGLAGTAAIVPLAWTFFLHEYQKNRILTFMNPEADPLGTGYHITQSKIALGSGGLSGKGFLQGPQSHLNFLPEKHTDFIFTLWAEEWGFIGGLAMLIVFAFVLIYMLAIATRIRHNFGRYLVLGLCVNFSLYVLINISMVMGLIPVVGVPLPMISYGGTAMLACLIGFGFVMSANIYRDSKVTRV